MSAITRSANSLPVSTASWNSHDELSEIASGNSYVQELAKKEYSSLDINQTFTDLCMCGGLLQVALTACGRQPCSVPILGCLDNFADLVNDSCITSGNFVDCSLAALRAHKLAFKAVEKRNVPMALKAFQKCATMAQEMSTLAGTLEEKAKSLSDKAAGGLTAAQNNTVVTNAERKKVEQMLSEVKAHRAAIESQLEDLAAEIQDAKEEENKFARSAAEQRDRAYTMQIVSSIGSTISNTCTMGVPNLGGGMLGVSQQDSKLSQGQSTGAAGKPAGDETRKNNAKNELREAKSELAKKDAALEAAKAAPDKDSKGGQDRIKEATQEVQKAKEKMDAVKNSLDKLAQAAERNAESLEAKEASAAAHRRRLCETKRQQNAAFKKSVAEMENMKFEKSELEQTVLCLTTAVQTMGKIVVTFKNVKMFWKSVAEHCKKLVELGGEVKDTFDILGDDVDMGLVEDGMYLSASSWAALGQVNLQAHRAMVKAKMQIDGILTTLPDGEACAQKIKALTKELQMSIAQEEQQLMLEEGR